MNFEEENLIVESLRKAISQAINGKECHVAIAIADQGECFAFSISTLTSETQFKNCSLIVKGIGEEAHALLEKFKIPQDQKIKKPIEPK